MRTVLLLCAALAGCATAPKACRPFDSLCDGGDAYDGGPRTDATLVCPTTAAECATIWLCPEVCHYDTDAGPLPEVDAGPMPEVDAGTDAGRECNPGVHTSACMNPASCVGADSICRPCC